VDATPRDAYPLTSTESSGCGSDEEGEPSSKRRRVAGEEKGGVSGVLPSIPSWLKGRITKGGGREEGRGPSDVMVMPKVMVVAKSQQDEGAESDKRTLPPPQQQEAEAAAVLDHVIGRMKWELYVDLMELMG